MRIIIKAGQLELTPALKDIVEAKIGALGKLLKRFEANGEIETHVELDRTTNHHQKGDVYRVAVNIQLPHRLVRVEERGDDIYATINKVKDILRRELAQYKERNGVSRIFSKIFRRKKEELG